MQSRFLSQEELGATLDRAREIAAQSTELASPGSSFEDYLKAGEELGIPRDAIVQALREQQLIPTHTLREGDAVFAPSADGQWYPATLTASGSHTATVRFVNGGEHSCALTDLRPLSLVPGRKIQVNDKDWGWCDADVKSFDERSGKVVANNGWGDASYALKNVRLSRRVAQVAAKKPLPDELRAKLVAQAWKWGAAGVAIGYALAQLAGMWLR
jgi:hypothetical protein